jgi:hypothetical protein
MCHDILFKKPEMIYSFSLLEKLVIVFLKKGGNFFGLLQPSLYI